jgi:hypothetical protein
MRNLQSFFNPNPGGTAVLAAAMAMTEESEQPSYIQKKMTDFIGPKVKQAPKATPIPVNCKKCRALSLTTSM